jgi:peroxin-14
MEAPLVQRIQFLESKGLNTNEIDEVFRQVSTLGSGNKNTPVHALSSSQAHSVGRTQSVYGLTQHPPPRQFDWRDYFVRSVVFDILPFPHSG